MKTAPPKIDKITPTGISNGAITRRAKMSHAVTVMTATITTHGKFDRKLSPRISVTKFGTTNPKNGSCPTTTTTVPDANYTSTVPSSTSFW